MHGTFIGAFVLSAAAVVFPELPELSLDRVPRDIRERLRQAYETARNNPRDASSNGDLGMILQAYEQHESAQACYRRARVIEPGAFRWAYYLGTVQSILGKHTEAARNLRDASRLDPSYVPARLRLANSLLQTGELKESRNILEFLVEQNPRLATAHYWLGRVLASTGQNAPAAAHFREACELAGSFGPAHYALAMALRDLGEAAESEKHFALYQRNKTGAPAIDDPALDAIEELKAGGALNHLKKGVALEQAGKLREAAREQERALEMEPNLIQAHINLISLYGKLGQSGQAERHYHRAMAINSSQMELHFNFGVVLAAQNRLSDAVTAFERALEINPFYAEAYVNLGQMLERLGRLDEARRQYDRALENHPNYRPAYFQLGRIMLLQNKPNDAVEFFLKTLVPQDDQTPLYLFGLATAYSALGDRERSKSYGCDARRQAISMGRTDLVKAIDRDLQTLNSSCETP